MLESGVVSSVNCRSQRVETRSSARRASAGLAVDNSNERNTADGRVSFRPKGAAQTAQCGVAATLNMNNYFCVAAPCLGLFE